MGRKTYQSIGRPLPGRTTCILTRQTAAELALQPLPENVSVSADWIGLLAQQPEPSTTVWVCGGGQIYAQLLPECSRLYLTIVKQFVEGDALFPHIPAPFHRDCVLFDSVEFRVERWINSSLVPTDPEAELWPF